MAKNYRQNTYNFITEQNAKNAPIRGVKYVIISNYFILTENRSVINRTDVRVEPYTGISVLYSGRTEVYG